MGRAEIEAVFFIPILSSTDRNELRQIVVERTQAVVHPSAECRKFAVQHIPSGVKLRLCHVIAIRRPHRADN